MYFHVVFHILVIKRFYRDQHWFQFNQTCVFLHRKYRLDNFQGLFFAAEYSSFRSL